MTNDIPALDFETFTAFNRFTSDTIDILTRKEDLVALSRYDLEDLKLLVGQQIL